MQLYGGAVAFCEHFSAAVEFAIKVVYTTAADVAEPATPLCAHGVVDDFVHAVVDEEEHVGVRAVVAPVACVCAEDVV